MTGRLVAIVGPSGAGKDTLIAGAVAARPDLVWARRTITRPATGNEPSEAVSEAEFERRRAAGAFAFWWTAHGLSYGIPASIHDHLAAGRFDAFADGGAGDIVALAEDGNFFSFNHNVLILNPNNLL